MSFRGPEGNSRREPITTAVRIQPLLFADDGTGRLVLTDDRRETPVPLVDDGTGRLVLDDAAPDGLDILTTPSRIMANG